MSKAKPKDRHWRLGIYLRRGFELTPRQRRRYVKKMNKNEPVPYTLVWE